MAELEQETKAGTAETNPGKAEPSAMPPGQNRPSGGALVPAHKGKAVVKRRISLAGRQIREGAQAIRQTAVPRAASSTALVVRKTTQVTLYLRRFNKRHTGPVFSRAFKWIARRLDPSSIGRDYRRLLLLVHAGFLDRSGDSLFFVRTRGRVSKVRLSIPSQVRAQAKDYRPTPVRVFHWAMSALAGDFEDTVFVDYGAGRGRVLLLASHHPFAKIVGAEIAAELHDDCLMNIAQYPRSLMRCRDVECVHTRATTLPIPQQPAVFYFFAPFSSEIFEKVLARITRSYKRNRRRIRLVCIDMNEQDAVDAPGIFHPVRMPPRERIRNALLSPYSLRIYETEP